MEDHTGRVKRLEEVAALVEAYLRDLPELVGWERVVREYETVPAECTPEHPLGIYTLTPGAIRERIPEEMEGLREGAEREWSARFRDLYEDLGLRATLDKDGTLEVKWGGGRGHATLPGVVSAKRRGRVAATYVPARQAFPEVHPGVAYPEALLATLGAWDHVVDLV